MAELLGVVGEYPHTDALFSKTIELSSGDTVVTKPYSWAGGGVPVASRTIRAVPGWDWDFAELPLVNFFSSTELGASYRALPVILTRRFVLNMLRVDRDVVKEPKDLEGRAVGIHYYGHSDTTWVRGLLAEHFDVDLSKITWVAYAEEQVPNVKLPANVVHLPRVSLEQMLQKGELAAQIISPVLFPGPYEGQRVGPLWPDALSVDRALFDKIGLLPVLHTVVVKRSVLDRYPHFAKEVFAVYASVRDEAIAQAKAGVQLRDSEIPGAVESGFPNRTLPFLPDDPIPYGLEANRKGLEMLIRMAQNMQIFEWDPPLEDLFLPVDQL